MIQLPTTHVSFFFFNDTATTEIYTLSLHDALPICDTPADLERALRLAADALRGRPQPTLVLIGEDRKSTRLNSSHSQISYAVFCLKKKNKTSQQTPHWRPRKCHDNCAMPTRLVH